MSKPTPNVAELPQTVKLTSAAKSLRMTPREFRDLCSKHKVPVLRPSERRELILTDHMRSIVYSIAEPALRPAQQGTTP